MITIYSSLYDSLFDNEDALAFIISHELAHFLLGHHQTSLENSNKIKELQNQIITLRSFQQIDALAKIEELNTEIDKIYAQERLLELNSDFEAITLMARAGYNIDCANNALKFLSNLPNVYTKRSSHPQIEERIVNVKEAIKLSNLERLKQEGRENIYNSKVLNVKKSSDKETIVITKSQNNYDFKYIPETKLDKLLKKAYLYYLENDLTLAKSYFEEAFKLNSKNYIPALYLSYICECEYYLNDNEKSLKKAGTWARKANKLNSKDKNTLKQKEEVLETIKKVKEANARTI
ncbi:MAG: M48 family metalloprotease, partial [Candidatus Gastranaerophilales bacterium]|nr:M48 family metalloprotease [Candidatus Gastranaerophilales bacterium]